jgi:hypothetical protein
MRVKGRKGNEREATQILELKAAEKVFTLIKNKEKFKCHKEHENVIEISYMQLSESTKISFELKLVAVLFFFFCKGNNSEIILYIISTRHVTNN